MPDDPFGRPLGGMPKPPSAAPGATAASATPARPADPAGAAPAGVAASEPWWGPAWQQIKASLPTQEDLARHRWLRPVAKRLSDRVLWRLRSESVARGVAIGLFWAFAVPVAQILFAAAHCVWWRGNIPVAAGVTLITNPLTVGGWLWLAYQVGSLMVDVPGPAPDAAPAEGLLAWIGSIGAPTLLGMGVFAVGGALAGYLVTLLVTRVLAALRLRSARRRRRDRQVDATAGDAAPGP